MAITGWREKWQGRGATNDGSGIRTLTRQWDVETDGDSTDEADVIDGLIALVPSAAIFASHPAWPWAIRRQIAGKPNGSGRIWSVEATYTNAPFVATAGDPTSETAPAALHSSETQADLRLPSFSVTRREITEPLEEDTLTGDPVANSLGDKFDPPVEVFRSHQVLTWKFFRLPQDVNWTTRQLYFDSVNLDVFSVLAHGYPPFSLRCTDYSLEAQWEQGPAGLTLYYLFTVQAEYNPRLWKVKVLNTGRRKRVGGSIGDPTNPARLANIVDDNGQPVAEPVPLDAGGQPVQPGGAFTYRTFDGYPAFLWSGPPFGLLF